MQTADLLFGRVDDLDAGWSEQAMPEFAGQLAATAHEEYPELIHPDGWSRQDAPRHRALEHIETVENRAICALRNAVLIPREGDIAVVTHGAVLVSLVRAAGLDARVVGNLAVAEVRAHATEGWELVSLHNPLE